jgi:hypothetical protein
MQIVTSLIRSSSSGSLISLVQGDTKPNLVINLLSENIHTSRSSSNTIPLNVNTANCVFKIRKVDTTTLIDSVNCVLLPGLENDDGTITLTAPYNQVGVGGRILVPWNTNSLSVSGTLEGEVEITFADGTIQTAYNVVKMVVRPQF